MTFRKWPITSVAAWMLGEAAFASPTSDAFATGFNIELEDQAPLYRLTLTPDVYRSSVTSDLSDIAVFNAAGGAVPYMLRAPAKNTVAANDWVSVPIFPVLNTDGAGNAERNITVQTDGTLIRIEGAAVAQGTKTIAAYIVDASRIQGRLTEIDVSLDSPGDELVLPVAVDGGRNLNSWRPLVKDFRLATLEFAGHRLTQTHISLPRGGARYLRLRPLQNNSQFRVKSIRARVRTEQTHSTALARFSVGGTSVAGQVGEIQFDLNGHFPIHELNVNFLPNKLIQATIESRSSPTGTWRHRQRGVFYALERDGLFLRPTSSKFAGVRDRYWRLTNLEPIPQSPLHVEIAVSWKAQELIFLAEGPAPYLLAVGRAALDNGANNYVASLAKISDPDLRGQASIGSKIVLGGAAKLTEVQAIPWRQILLWGILVGAVAAVGVMVVRLVRQMKS